MPTAPDSPAENSTWLDKILQRAGANPSEGWKPLYEKMDALASRTAPVARTMWVWIVAVQGLCVLAPMLWLARAPMSFRPSIVALVVLAAVGLMVGVLWWLRWRGMQGTWAEARLVAEVARAYEAAQLCPEGRLKLAELEMIPGMREMIAAVPHAATPAQPWPHWREVWSKARLEDQLSYYIKARGRAEAQRLAFTKWSTRLMDLMLALAAAALVITLDKRATQWLWVLGELRFDCFLGLTSACLPLGIILIQMLRTLQEVNRRAARFARQIEILEEAKRNLATAQDEDAAIQVVHDSEVHLLGEVVDWYYEAQTAERFFQVRERKGDQTSRAAGSAGGGFRWARPATWLLALGGIGLLFVGRVVIGRAGWVACSSALTLGWLSYSAPDAPEGRKSLEAIGSLRDTNGSAWVPDSLRANNGCLIIAHGLHDGAFTTSDGLESRWMRDMAASIEGRLGEKAPAIGLVDWAAAAFPTELHGINVSSAEVSMALDVAGIRAQARNVGDFLAFRLAQWVRDGRIRKDRPLHFIGHSAGGFVVARAAKLLKEINLAPEVVHVTILDTPGPDAELLEATPKLCTLDFYVTSSFVLGLSEESPPAGVFLRQVKSEKALSLLEAHSYAHQWYTRSIPDTKSGDAGFGRSPFATP